MLQFLLISAHDHLQGVQMDTNSGSNEIQHMKLHHFSYIKQSKLQHILSLW